MKRFLSSGFTITEVMVGGAILAGVALAGAQLFKEQRKAQTKVDQDQEILMFHQSLTKFLQDDKNCSSTFKLAHGISPAAMVSFDINTFTTCTTCTNPAFKYDASNVNQVATPMAEGAWLNPQSYMWRITDVRWKSTPTGTGAAVLKVTYGTDPAWPNSRAKKVYSVSKDINLVLRFTQNTNPALRQFKGCVSPKESSINNLQNDICGTMTQVTSTGNIMVWSDATQGCVALGNTSTPVKKCAAANMVIDGINADGTVRCKMLTDGVNPAGDLMDNTGCAPGSSIRMEFDTVTRKVKAVCY